MLLIQNDLQFNNLSKYIIKTKNILWGNIFENLYYL